MDARAYTTARAHVGKHKIRTPTPQLVGSFGRQKFQAFVFWASATVQKGPEMARCSMPPFPKLDDAMRQRCGAASKMMELPFSLL